jgi:ABC-type polysaccharide/polyol phosphate export permease
MVLSGLNVFFRDTSQFVVVGMQLLFWFNPIVYPRSRFIREDAPWAELGLLEKLGYALLRINPIERYISAAQYCVGASAAPPTALDWTILALFTPLCLVVGVVLFRRMLPDARDCL